MERIVIDDPIKFIEINEFKLIKQANSHSVVELSGYVSDIEGEKLIDFSGKTLRIGIEDGNYLFVGLIEKITYHIDGNSYRCSILANSYTIESDRALKNRIFQDPDHNYRQVVETVFSNYPKIQFFFDKSWEEKLDKPLIQYQETDWNFFKRLSSKLKSFSFLRDKISDMTEVLINQTGMEEDCNNMFYDLSYDKNNQFVTMLSDRIFNPGDVLPYSNLKRIIYQAKYINRKGWVNCHYQLHSLDDLYSLSEYKKPPEIITLVAKVLDNNDQEKRGRILVEFDQEEIDDMTSAKYWFNLKTAYSGNETGVFLLPEIDETVVVKFFSDFLNISYIEGVIRDKNKKIEYEPKQKVLRTPSGKEIRIDEDLILISALDEDTYIKLTQDKNINIVTGKDVTEIILKDDEIFIKQKNQRITLKDNQISIENDKSKILLNDNIEINSKGKILLSGESVTIKTKSFTTDSNDIALKGNKINFSSSGDIDIKGSTVKIN